MCTIYSRLLDVLAREHRTMVLLDHKGLAYQWYLDRVADGHRVLLRNILRPWTTLIFICLILH